MSKIKSITLVTLSIIIGLVFIFSGWTKIESVQSFETFQYTFVEYLFFPWTMAGIMARLFVGIEFILGALITVHLFGKNKWVLKFALALLGAFTVYLIYLWIVAGDNINCGCFGDHISVKPSSSIIKNLILALATFIVLRFHKGLTFRKSALATGSLTVILLILPFILYPVPDTKIKWLKDKSAEINLSSLYKPGKTDQPKVQLTKGKHVIAFFSLTCPHCKTAAYKLHLMKEKNAQLPFFMVLNGDTSDLTAFWEKTKAQNIPFSFLRGQDFVDMAGYSLPTIYFIHNGIIEAEANYLELNQSEIEAWLKQ